MRQRRLLCSIVIFATTVLAVDAVGMSSSHRSHARESAPRAVRFTRATPPDRGRYRRHLFSNVTVHQNIEYARVTNRDGVSEALHLDIYAPSPDSARKRAAILWLHPGGFTAGDKSGEARYAQDFAQRGYVSIAIDYRLRPTMPWFDMEQRRDAARDAYDDATTSLRWIRLNASRYGIDPTRLFVAGYSAGAITAQEVAAPPDGSPSLVVGVMSIAGYATGPARVGLPPRILFHGTHDLLVPYDRDRSGCEEVRKFKSRCELVTIVNGEHDIGFLRFADIADQTAQFFASIANGHA